VFFSIFPHLSNCFLVQIPKIQGFSVKHYLAIERLEASLYTLGTNICRASGIITFKKEISLKFVERINIKITNIYFYSYEIRQDSRVLYFYDPQPHPENHNLASTFPHHKHVPPNIKRNRHPAPGISYEKPNLPFLIQEIIDNLL